MKTTLHIYHQGKVQRIRDLFGSGPASDCAMDAREYKRGGNPKNPGQFSKGGASSGSKAPAKPAPKRDASAQAFAAGKAQAAKNAAKPKKPTKSKASTEANAHVKQFERAKARAAKPAEALREKAKETPAKAAEKPAKAKTKKQIAEEKRRAEFNEEYARMMAAVPSPEKPSSYDIGHRVSFTVPAIVGNGKAIRAARGGIVQSIDDKGRLRVLDQNGSLHTLDPSEITNNAGPVPGEKERIQARVAPTKTASPKAEKQPKVTNPDVSAAKRAATALRKFEAGMEGKSASEIRKLEAQHVELLSKANATAKKAGVPTDAFEKKANVGKAAKSKTSDVPPKPKVTQTEGGKEEARMRSAFSTIGAAAKAIPQKLDDAKSYSPEWRLLLQAVRNMEASPQLGAQGMESIRKASRGIKPVAAGEHAASERNALLAAIKETKASPKAAKQPKATKVKSAPSATKAAPKPKAPKKSTAHADLGSAFAAVPSRRRGGSNPDHAS